MDFYSLTQAIDPEFIRRMLALLLLSIARLSAFFAVFPVFGRIIPSGLLRTGIVFGFAMMVYPSLAEQYDLIGSPGLYGTMILLMKEAFIGLCLGLAFGFLAWGMEAAGNLIDFNRGAFVAAMFSPLTQVESTPVGTFLIMIYSAFLLVSGAFLFIIGIVYDSYVVWPIMTFYPEINAALPLLMLAGMDKLMTVMILISGPIIILNFATELALSIYTRYAQQLNVFIFALPIKSGIAFFMLIMMMPYLFDILKHDLFFIEYMYDRLKDILGG